MAYYKKIDRSFFEYSVVTIPQQISRIFLFGRALKKGDSRKVQLYWKGKKTKHDGIFLYSKRSTGKNDYYQIKWGIESKLSKEFKKTFIQTYLAILNQKYTGKPIGKFKKIVLLGGKQEVLILRPKSHNLIELETFIQIKTDYDKVFHKLVDENVFGWFSKTDITQLITQSSRWYKRKELSKIIKDTTYVVYYLLDKNDDKIYIGSAKRLGDRVKPGRKEIPGWTHFKYEKIHPQYQYMMKSIEFHAIRAFAGFFNNNGNVRNQPVSEYSLVNKNWPKRL